VSNAADEAEGWVLVLLHHAARFHLLVLKHFFPAGASIREGGVRGQGGVCAHVVDGLRRYPRVIQQPNPVLRVTLLKDVLQQGLQLGPVGHALRVGAEARVVGEGGEGER